MADVTLFSKDSMEDLACRGFSKAEITGRFPAGTKFDWNHIWRTSAGVDAIGYAVAFVTEHVGMDTFRDCLNRYGRKNLSRAGFMTAIGCGSRRVLSIKKLSAELGLADAYAEAHAMEVSLRDAVRRKTMQDRFGAETMFESAYFKTKSKASCLERHGVENTGLIPGIHEKMRETMTSKYGADHPMRVPEIRDRIRGTMRERYGVDYTLSSDELRAKAQDTMEARYGARTTLQSDALKAKADATVREKYGVDHVSRIPGVTEKAVMTNMVRRGVPNAMMDASVVAKALATRVERYGEDWMSEDGVLAERRRATMVRRYGVPYAGQMPDFMEKLVKASREKYGTDFPAQNPDVAAKTMCTCEAVYGVPYVFQSEAVRAKAVETSRRKYGTDYPVQSQAVKDRIFRTKTERGTFSTSEPERELGERLAAVFGDDDVLAQYNDDARYSFHCDFYVKSRDMFIELNGYWSHGPHWYGESPSEDEALLAKYRNRTGPQYAMFEAVWTGSDVKKRETAKQNNLNYVVFWGDEGQDVDLWFAMGCPDGRDWDRMYSWLPERELAYDGGWPETLKQQGRSIPAAARMANWREFYKRELALWDLNYDNKWGTVQARLYANRFKYIGKLPDELTNREILRGLNIAGMVRAYSHFDNSGMVEFLRDYDIKSLYDPCAGWGERMLTCMVSGVEYAGTDINPASVDAHMLLLDKYREYAPGRAYVALGDSAERDMTAGVHEAVFTCPPYGDREIYTDSGAENLDPDAFLDWWRRVAEHSVSGTTRAFAYQIDQVWKDRMNAVVESLGWRLDRQIQVGRNRVSHMTRSRGDGTKHNFEEVQVFVR